MEFAAITVWWIAINRIYMVSLASSTLEFSAPWNFLPSAFLAKCFPSKRFMRPRLQGGRGLRWGSGAAGTIDAAPPGG